MAKFKQKHGLLIIGILCGVGYALVTRIVFGKASLLASGTFLFVVPTLLGILPMTFADKERLTSYRNIVFIPWLTVMGFFLTLFVFGVEDFLCLLILGAPFFILATVGAFIVRMAKIDKKKDKGKLLSLALLPFLLAPLEGYISSPSDIYEIKNVVVISASPEQVWDNIVEVKAIDETEYNAGFFNSIGIPRPISASVDRKEKGGHRVGNFEGGLKFVETITTYEENKKVSFDIEIDPETVRERVFDQHVLKGNYFTFVNATYELVEMENGQVELTLSSSYQLTSTINFYGKFWGDIILSDFQSRLLDVVAGRCEGPQN